MRMLQGVLLSDLLGHAVAGAKQMERVTKNLSAAIATMRAACDDAERRSKTAGDAYAVQQVLHALSWGMANASSSIQCAMAAVEDESARKAFSADAVEERERCAQIVEGVQGWEGVREVAARIRGPNESHQRNPTA